MKNKLSQITLGQWVALLLAIAAIINELRKPSEERTWHDRLFGFVSYDLRIPTLERFKLSLWNTQSDKLLVPTAVGVGWNANLRGLLKYVGLIS